MMDTTRKLFFEFYYRNKSSLTLHKLPTLPTKTKEILEIDKTNLVLIVPGQNLAEEPQDGQTQ